MKRILVVLNGLDYPAHVVAYAIRLAKADASVLEPVLLAPVALQAATPYLFPKDLTLAGAELPLPGLAEADWKLMQTNLDLFQEDCTEGGVAFQMGAPTPLDLEELLDQTAYADLVLSEAKLSVGDFLLEELLADAHCPVLLVPQQAQLPARTVLCYDESLSSLHALKMYSYLFPQFSSLPASLVTINPKGDNGSTPSAHLQHWLPLHFRRAETRFLEGNLQKELTRFIGAEAHDTLVVMGAYSRNALSRLFHKSLSAVVMEQTGATLFIVHD